MNSMKKEEAMNELLIMLAKYTFDIDEAQAIGKALDALRPVSRGQVEKVWRGEWELVRRMAAAQEFRCSVCGANNTYYGHPKKFCADCGSAMTDEAVQMVMERLEALHNDC